MKDKLISFPEEILIVLDEYKKKTGIPATDYVRRAVVKQMIVEGLIFIQTKYIIIEKDFKDNGGKASMLEAIEANKFCDGDSCEVDYSKPKLKGGGC